MIVFRIRKNECSYSGVVPTQPASIILYACNPKYIAQCYFNLLYKMCVMSEIVQVGDVSTKLFPCYYAFFTKYNKTPLKWSQLSII